MRKRIEKANKKEFRVEKVIKRKVKKRNYILNGNTMIVLLIVGLIMSECFPKSKSSVGRAKVVSNYAAEADLKNATGVDTSKSVKNVDLASLKSEVDKLDSDKLEKVPTGLNSLNSKVDKLDVDKLLPVPVDLSKLSVVVKNYVVKKDVYNAKIKDIEDKIPDITNLSY